jgi:hypothetical protein
MKIYVLLGGHFVGCDRTNTHTHPHTTQTYTHTHTQHTHTHTQDGSTALHLAAYNGHGGIAKALLKAGCNADIQDKV